jgi:prohibitin 2
MSREIVIGEFATISQTPTMQTQTVAKLIGVAILVFVVIIFSSTGTYVVQPGYRGVEVTLGKVSSVFKPEGFGWKMPFITHIVPVLIRQQTQELPADCYSSDLQQVKTTLRVLYRIPENSVVNIYQAYAGDPFDSLIAPRIQEALKEVTALQSAEQIVKKREEIKNKTLVAAREKISAILIVEDIVIQNIELTKELETAIESKMVQEQEAAKAKFTQQKAQIEADTAIIKAKGDAESIRIRGEALKLTPAFIELQIVEKWDGKTPLVVGASGGGANILLPLTDLERRRAQSAPGNAP